MGKQVGKGREKEKIKIIVPLRSYPTNQRKFQNKKQKNLKNIIIATFQAKIGRKRLGKRENKNYRFIMFLPNRLEKIPKNNNEIQKIQLWHHFKPKQVGKG